MKQKTHHWKLLIKQKSVISLLITLGICLIIVTYFLVNTKNSLNQQSTAITFKASIIDTPISAPGSVIVKPNGNSRFSLFNTSKKTARGASLDNSQNAIFRSSSVGVKAANDFLSSNPQFKTANGQTVNILPLNFDQNSTLIKSLNDQTDPFLADKNIDKNREHYYYQQTIQGIPVYGANLAIHIKNTTSGGEVYSTEGNLTLNENINDSDITLKRTEELKQIALNTAGKIVPKDVAMEAVAEKKIIINPAILGEKGDTANYVTIPIQIITSQPSMNMEFYIDLAGNILFAKKLASFSLNRSVYYNKPSCLEKIPYTDQFSYQYINCISKTRTEGDPEMGEYNSDLVYKYLGDAYNYFNDGFRWDSFDNRGKKIEALTNISPEGAFYSPLFKKLYFSNSHSTRGTAVHEYTHAIVGHTAGLERISQSASLNEGIADTFAAIEQNDWNFIKADYGNEWKLYSSINNPEEIKSPNKLFGGYFRCSKNNSILDEISEINIHKNGNVISYAAYLLSEGKDNFNGCSIQPIGANKTAKIFFRALTTYLNPLSNYKEMYFAMNKACDDLFGTETYECQQVKNAMQAVELDQQPLGEQNGAACLGLTERTPECAVNNNETAPPTSKDCYEDSCGGTLKSWLISKGLEESKINLFKTIVKERGTDAYYENIFLCNSTSASKLTDDQIVSFCNNSSSVLPPEDSIEKDQSCSNPCTQCIINNRDDILPFYAGNGWSTECSNREKIIENWCDISPVDCSNIKNGDCASQCNNTTEDSFPTSIIPSINPPISPDIPISDQTMIIGDCNTDDYSLYPLWTCEWPDGKWKNCLGKSYDKQELFERSYCSGTDGKGPELMWKFQAAQAHGGIGNECGGIEQKLLSSGC